MDRSYRFPVEVPIDLGALARWASFEDARVREGRVTNTLGVTALCAPEPRIRVWTYRQLMEVLASATRFIASQNATSSDREAILDAVGSLLDADAAAIGVCDPDGGV